MSEKEPTSRLESMRTMGQLDPKKMDPRNRSSEFWSEADRNYVALLASDEAARILEKAKKQTNIKANSDEYNRMLSFELSKLNPSQQLFQPSNDLDWSH